MSSPFIRKLEVELSSYLIIVVVISDHKDEDTICWGIIVCVCVCVCVCVREW